MATLPITLFADTQLGRDARLKGRPKLCSDCGVCSSSLRPLMAQSCVFVNNQTEAIERQLHGRNRHDGDELLFGISQQIHVARMAQPIAGAQWSGIVSSLGVLLLERQVVDGVIVVQAAPGTTYAPMPILARTAREVAQARGNKPCISPNLEVLDQVRESGIKRLAFVGVGCQVHALRAMQAELGLEKLYIIGIPCTDSTTYPDLQRFLALVSDSPETVVHHEFMPDFRLWLTHRDGRIEKRNFVDLDVQALGGQSAMFPDACMSCFDYHNTLSDVTVGYLGAPWGWQWMFVRTAVGAELFELIKPALEFGALEQGGDRQVGVQAYIKMMPKPMRRPPWLVRKLVAWLQRSRGPRGVEFARSVTEMKLLRNLQHVRQQHRRLERRIVPNHVYRALHRYANVYEETFGRSLAVEADHERIRA